jgi:hypothetical protein
MSDAPDNRPSEMNDPHDAPVMTSYIESEPPEEEYVAYDDDFGADETLPGRPRRVLVNRYSAGLVAVLIGAACFYGGVRVEKSKVSSTAATSGTGLAGLAARFGAASGTGSAATAGTGGRTRGGTSGTISTISGDTVYLTEASGNTVKVKLSSATTLTKTVSVSKRSLYPGDTVSVTGSTGSGGTVSATAIADSGSSTASSSSATASSGTTGSTGASSTGSGSSGLGALFSG